MPKHLLIHGEADPVPDPTWEAIAAALSDVNPRRSVILYKEDGRHLRADGARLVYTIVFYRTARVTPLLLGRKEGGRRRGVATLDQDRVIVSTLEWWGSDGSEVFRAFLQDKPLEEHFTLRDPAVPCSRADIRRAINGTG